MIDPNFWQSEDVSKLTIRQRLLLIGLFSNADDEGKLRGNPAFVRSVVFPYEDFTTGEIDSDLAAIEDIGTIRMYEVNGNRYIKLRNWRKFQKVEKPQPSMIPNPIDEETENDSVNESENDSPNHSGNGSVNEFGIIPEKAENDSRLKEKKLKEVKLKEDKSNNGESSSPKPKKYSDDEKEPVNYLKKRLDELGVTKLPRDWHLKGYAVSRSLMSGEKPLTKEQVIQIIDWGLSHEYWGTRIDSMSTIQTITPKWQLEHGGDKNGRSQNNPRTDTFSVDEMVRRKQQQQAYEPIELGDDVL